MNELIDKIYEDLSLDEIRELLQSQQDQDELRELLFQEFLKYADYTCASEWNRAVRLTECLAIIGWGEHEPLQASRGRFINGDPSTMFYNANGDTRFVRAFWSEGKYGLIMRTDVCWFDKSPEDPLDRENTDHYPVIPKRENIKLQNQRNWISKNPIYISLLMMNHLYGSTPVVQSIYDELQAMLDSMMRPYMYGNLFNLISINIFFSYEPMTNKIVGDEIKLKRYVGYHVKEFNWEKLRFEEKTVCHRYEIGPFRKNTGNIYSTLSLEREFSLMHPKKQKEELAKHFIFILEKIFTRLRKKHSFNFDLMLSDFKNVMEKWIALPIIKPPYRFEYGTKPMTVAGEPTDFLSTYNFYKNHYVSLE